MTRRDDPEMLMRSKHLAYFERHGQIFAYHNLFGYLLGMSRDLVDLLEFHASDLRTREEVDSRFSGQFEAEQLDEFIMVFKMFSCLIDSELSEHRSVWTMVPVRSRWVVYHHPSANELDSGRGSTVMPALKPSSPSSIWPPTRPWPPSLIRLEPSTRW
ncbi:MAG: hypothetical protein ACI9OJ_004883 [Myxococcota bacterium]|jgi:hypothetical protein